MEEALACATFFLCYPHPMTTPNREITPAERGLVNLFFSSNPGISLRSIEESFSNWLLSEADIFIEDAEAILRTAIAERFRF